MWRRSRTGRPLRDGAFVTLLRNSSTIRKDQIPLSIGGGIGQGRLQMLLLRKAHFGEVTVTVWPKQLHEVCEKHNIFVLK